MVDLLKEGKAADRSNGHRRASKGYATALVLPLLLSSCRLLPAGEAQVDGARQREQSGPVAVETARVEMGTLDAGLSYTGTTVPAQQVTLRSQLSGEITALTVEVGDPVAQGILLAQLDGDPQTASVNQAAAELSARRAELTQADVSVTDAQAALIQAQATFEQAQVDAARLRRLANRGGISAQEAEAAELLAANAQQAVRSAQAQLAARQEAAQAVANRVEAQQAIVTQAQTQLSYTDLRSPLTGTVLSRPTEVGNYIESGDTILEIGDLSTLKATVQVSELNLAQLSLGQPAQVTLDAFPDLGETSGRITQIAPVADPVSRLVPVEVTLPNPNGRVGSGLLARVQFGAGTGTQMLVPASALTVGDAMTEDEDAMTEDATAEDATANETSTEQTIYVVEGEGEQVVARPRSVRVGDREGSRVEIVSGLAANEVVIVQSERPLSPGQAVRLSILSE
ncbi:MAG: efflux RND transporter periplasmic adaptor subunit [Cyanobacteria bacterium P01_D01_bin.14]